MNDDHGLFARLATARARREQEVAGFLAALTEGREPTAEQQQAYTAAGRAERIRCRSLARDGLLGPLAQAEQLIADAYEQDRRGHAA